jgi:hypothetical protein
MGSVKESDRKYIFVAAYEEVDYPRVLREAPEGTPFILVETQTRTKQAKDYELFIHNSILTDERVQGLTVGNQGTLRHITTISPTWGHNDDIDGLPYRYIGGDGAIPGYIKQQVEAVKRLLNPKDTRNVVTFL